MMPLAFSSVLLEGFIQSDFFGQMIVIIQLIISFFALTIMIGKWRELNKIQFDTVKFVRKFMECPDALQIYMQRMENRKSPMEVIYHTTCERLLKTFQPNARRQLIGKIDNAPDAALTRREIELLTSTAEHTLAEQVLRLEHGMTPLATAVSSAPMLGLFGTVWGIMVAFQAMGVKGSAMLSELAPGISSALLTTVVGLLVAIPATIGYNLIHTRVKKLVVECEGFTDELMSRIACELQGLED